MGSLPFGGIIAFGGGVQEDSTTFGECELLLDRVEETRSFATSSGGGRRKNIGGGAKELKAEMALKSHREAERRRRDRINSHLTKLRTLVPTSSKLEKAALLAEVIERVKELKSNTVEINKRCTLPSDTDELRVELCDDDMTEGTSLLKVSLCCEDRPELITDLKQALRSLQLKTIRAEISTLGGRLKNVFVMSIEGHATNMERSMVTTTVQQALQAVLDRGAAQMDLLYPMGEKRRRFSPIEQIGCPSS